MSSIYNLNLAPAQAMNAGSISLYLLLHIQKIQDVQVTFIERGNGGATLSIVTEDMRTVANEILQDSALYALKEENEAYLTRLTIFAPASWRDSRDGLPTAESDHLP